MFSDLGLANALMERVSARTSRVKRTAILVTGDLLLKSVVVSPEPPVGGETCCLIASDNETFRVTRCLCRIRKLTTAVRQREQGGSCAVCRVWWCKFGGLGRSACTHHVYATFVGNKDGTRTPS